MQNDGQCEITTKLFLQAAFVPLTDRNITRPIIIEDIDTAKLLWPDFDMDMYESNWSQYRRIVSAQSWVTCRIRGKQITEVVPVIPSEQ
jgi:hypothetical protein